MIRSHRVAWGSIIVLAGALCTAGYVVLGPGPMAFAGGHRLPLASYAVTSLSPSGVPSEFENASLVAKGEYLTRAADCMVCHTAASGAPYTGGRAFVLPFGTIYSTNITPDSDTGIGRYSDREFLDVLHRGRGRRGNPLYPAMPYTSYTLMTDADALAIKAYLFTLKPLRAAAPPNSLMFPFNQRSLMVVWSAFFNSNRRFEANGDRSEVWNRGAYLTEALGHCGECHTPRNLGMALNQRAKFQGAVQDGWRAYNITQDSDAGVGAWSDTDLAHYLSVGHADGRGTASGPMGEAVDESLHYLSGSDIAAMVAYLRTVPAGRSADLPAPRAAPAAEFFEDEQAADPRGKAVYEGACAGCHGWSGVSPVLSTATLTGTRAVNDPTAENVAQVILRGGQRRTADESVHMPEFGSTYSDSEIASVANFVTQRFGVRGSTLNAHDIDKLRNTE